MRSIIMEMGVKTLEKMSGCGEEWAGIMANSWGRGGELGIAAVRMRWR